MSVFCGKHGRKRLPHSEDSLRLLGLIHRIKVTALIVMMLWDSDACLAQQSSYWTILYVLMSTNIMVLGVTC